MSWPLGDTRRLLLAYAALNAILYSMLLPLWEGFDEPFHFGYVQHLANGESLPDARTALLSREVWQSILLVPASEPVKFNLPQVVTYAEYFRLPFARRLEAQHSTRDIPRANRWQPSGAGNYEAQQAPLAYALLALPERLLSAASIPVRVLILRLIAALAGALLLFTATAALCAELSIPEIYRNIALFCVFSTQMTWATLAHVANDWLAVPLAIWTLVFMIRAATSPTGRHLVYAALILSAGLLTKAYFLAILPVFVVVAVVKGKRRDLVLSAAIIAVAAGPWYLRNYSLYRAITGTQEERAGVGLMQALHAATALDWLRVTASAIRGSLWTANNTFGSFSLPTMNVIVAVCAAAFLLWIFTRHTRAEWIVAGYSAAFSLAIAYTAAVTYVGTHNPLSTPPAWYGQVLVAPLFALALLGIARRPNPGKFLAVAISSLFGYLLAATYLIKLIPLYAGFEGRGSLNSIAGEYFLRIHALIDNLNSVALASATWIFTTTIAVIVLAVVLEIQLVRGILAPCTKYSSFSVRARRPSSSAPSC